MVDWPTIASLATAAGTLVLAGATFASVRSANRTARAAERSLQEGLRPLVVPTRPEDPPQKVMWNDAHKAMVSGGYGVAEEVDGNIYLAATVRNAGAGIAVLHSWFPHVGRETSSVGPPPIEDFRRLTRDLYIPARDNGFWQGAIREPDDPHRELLSQAIAERNLILIDLLYGDHEGGQRTITRFGLTPLDNGSWLTSVSRYWHIDGPEPR
jgi:hypothetical protein